MSKARPTPSAAEPENDPASSPACVVAGIPEPPGAKDEHACVVLSHDVLFTSVSVSMRCDACGGSLSATDDGDDEQGYGVRGQGVYHWVRGDERRPEKVPLCPSCAAAIGMTALARWEIEEEEG
jgi:hypothetical protein